MAMEMIGDLFGLPYFIFASSSTAPERVALAIRAQICNLAAPTEPVGVHGTRIQILGAHCQSVMVLLLYHSKHCIRPVDPSERKAYEG